MQGEGLFTDLYELTMLQAYFNEGMEEDAVFDLFVRRLPPGRNFLISCGLEQVLEYLEQVHFDQASLDYLESLDLFSRPFLHYLESFRFTGNVRAMPEGTAAFPHEPLIEIEAPMPQAQLIETCLLNQVTFQTLIASKGARAVLTARGKTLVDFGSRRAHGEDAALKAARALYIAGYAATSNVLAGRLWGIPVTGTMAHSYIQAHDSEVEAFRRFVQTFPETVLLLDTYDTEAGADRAIEVTREIKGRGIRAVRLDSGDMAYLAKAVRQKLDAAGLNAVEIFASGGLDEEEIAALLAAGAPIDAFGVGTSAVVSTDSPALDSVYKLVSYAGESRLKLSTDKAILPGKKQVWRREADGVIAGDTIALQDETLDGTPLLRDVMLGGRRTRAAHQTLDDVRARVRRELGSLPPALQGLETAAPGYPVTPSPRLDAERQRIAAAMRAP